jgi:hypothetical protein
VVTDNVDRGNAVVIAGDRFAIDQEERTLNRSTASTMSG